jgi:hypothetical protein
MSDKEMSSATLLDELAALEPQPRHQLATTLRQVSETPCRGVGRQDGLTRARRLGPPARLGMTPHAHPYRIRSVAEQARLPFGGLRSPMTDSPENLFRHRVGRGDDVTARFSVAPLVRAGRS